MYLKMQMTKRLIIIKLLGKLFLLSDWFTAASLFGWWSNIRSLLFWRKEKGFWVEWGHLADGSRGFWRRTRSWKLLHILQILKKKVYTVHRKLVHNMSTLLTANSSSHSNIVLLPVSVRSGLGSWISIKSALGFSPREDDEITGDMIGLFSWILAIDLGGLQKVSMTGERATACCDGTTWCLLVLNLGEQCVSCGVMESSTSGLRFLFFDSIGEAMQSAFCQPFLDADFSTGDFNISSSSILRKTEFFVQISICFLFFSCLLTSSGKWNDYTAAI